MPFLKTSCGQNIKILKYTKIRVKYGSLSFLVKLIEELLKIEKYTKIRETSRLMFLNTAHRKTKNSSYSKIFMNLSPIQGRNKARRQVTQLNPQCLN